MTPTQQLVALGLLSIKTIPEIQRITLLDTAGDLLAGDIADVCKAEATCLRHAQQHQLTLDQLLIEATQRIAA